MGDSNDSNMCIYIYIYLYIQLYAYSNETILKLWAAGHCDQGATNEALNSQPSSCLAQLQTTKQTWYEIIKQ
jgi:hypothetical protein